MTPTNQPSITPTNQPSATVTPNNTGEPTIEPSPTLTPTPEPTAIATEAPTTGARKQFSYDPLGGPLTDPDGRLGSDSAVFEELIIRGDSRDALLNPHDPASAPVYTTEELARHQASHTEEMVYSEVSFTEARINGQLINEIAAQYMAANPGMDRDAALRAMVSDKVVLGLLNSNGELVPNEISDVIINPLHPAVRAAQDQDVSELLALGFDGIVINGDMSDTFLTYMRNAGMIDINGAITEEGARLIGGADADVAAIQGQSLEAYLGNTAAVSYREVIREQNPQAPVYLQGFTSQYGSWSFDPAFITALQNAGHLTPEGALTQSGADLMRNPQWANESLENIATHITSINWDEIAGRVSGYQVTGPVRTFDANEEFLGHFVSRGLPHNGGLYTQDIFYEAYPVRDENGVLVDTRIVPAFHLDAQGNIDFFVNLEAPGYNPDDQTTWEIDAERTQRYQQTYGLFTTNYMTFTPLPQQMYVTTPQVDVTAPGGFTPGAHTEDAHTRNSALFGAGYIRSQHEEDLVAGPSGTPSPFASPDTLALFTDQVYDHVGSNTDTIQRVQQFETALEAELGVDISSIDLAAVRDLVQLDSTPNTLDQATLDLVGAGADGQPLSPEAVLQAAQRAVEQLGSSFGADLLNSAHHTAVITQTLTLPEETSLEGQNLPGIGRAA